MKYKNLKYKFIVFFLFLSAAAWSQPTYAAVNDSLLYYNKVLSPQQMQEDLQLLHTIRKKVNSGLYRYRTKKQIDSIYNWALERIKEPMHTIEFYKIILQLTDFEGSVHNYTEVDTELMEFLKRQKSFFPYPLTYINGQIIFDGYSEIIPASSRIVNINGIRDVELLQSFHKYYPADGFTVTKKLSASVNRSFGVNYLLEYGLTNEYKVEYITPNSKLKKEAILPAVNFQESTKNQNNSYSAPITDLINFKTQAPYSFELLTPTVGLLNLRWFGMVTGEEDPKFEPYVRFLDSVFNEMDKKSIPNLIIDIRNNPGGSDPTFEQPMMYLSEQPFKENVEAYITFSTDSLPYEEYFWGISTSEPMDSSALEMGKEFLKDCYPVYRDGQSLQNQKYNPIYYPKSPNFKGNLYLLINENVASAASHFASLVKGYSKNTTIIGVETVGGYYSHNGHIPFVYQLPNSKIKTKFSIVSVEQDAPKKPNQPRGRGIIPDYEVWPSLDDFMKHRDTQLEFTLHHIKEKK